MHYSLIISVLLVTFRSTLGERAFQERDEYYGGQKKCVIEASGTDTTDDAPAIRKAFDKCGRGGRVVFQLTTYHINTVLNVSGLENVDIDIFGTLSWGTNISYWLNNSLPVGFQNHSTAFILGGNRVRINGHGTGTFNGNGDDWYRFIRQQPNTSNYPGRPHALTLNGLTNSIVRGLNFLRSQMWTMSIIHSHHVDLVDIFINNTGNIYQSCRSIAIVFRSMNDCELTTAANTDGADTIDSSFINMKNWTVYNDDDSIALKGNSTNITITDSRFFDGLGIAIGSLGQFYGEEEVVSGFRVSNIDFHNTLHAVYFKTWTANRNGYPPNGGGGGTGYVEDLQFEDLGATQLRSGAVTISQCTRFSGAPGQGNCTNSPLQIRDIFIDGLVGTTKDSKGRVASFQCSAVAPCTNISLFNVDLKLSNGTSASQYLCGNLVSPRGFNCTGEPCVGGSATGGC